MVIDNSSLPDDHLNLATLDIDRAAWEIREENKSTEMTKKNHQVYLLSLSNIDWSNLKFDM